LWISARALSVGDRVSFTNNVRKRDIFEVIKIEETKCGFMKRYYYRYIDSGRAFNLVHHDETRLYLHNSIYDSLDWLWEKEADL